MLFNKKTFSPKNLKNRFLINYSFLKKELVSRGLPTEITIELTNICNLHCIMCPHDKMKRKQGFMDFNLFKKIIDQVKSHVEIVDLDLFGESLMNPEAFKMIKYCKSKGLKTLVNSNMTHMNEEKCKKLINSGLDMLTISFDGATKETYEKVRKGANYEQTLQNIKTFLKLKGQGKPHTRIQMIYMTHTESEAKKFLEIWKKTNADLVRIKPFINLDREKKFYAIEHLKQKQNERPCIYLWRNLSVYWNGDVVPCCDDYDSMYVVGNVNKKPIKEIWNDKPLVELRRKHIQGKQNLVRLCKECRYFEPSNLFVIGSIFIDAFTARQILPFFEKMIILKNKKFLKY
ncbi:MAG: radical SAM protein [Nanoarchaeota archaeon]|nr:radical SAM protein [Nanoarchaeota archaeon]